MATMATMKQAYMQVSISSDMIDDNPKAVLDQLLSFANKKDNYYTLQIVANDEVIRRHIPDYDPATKVFTYFADRNEPTQEGWSIVK